MDLEHAIQRSHEILDEAMRAIENSGKQLVGVYGLFSGGNDSTTFVHLMRQRLDGVIHINTGMGVPETRRFVREVCRRFDLPLRIYAPRAGSGDTYEELVMRWGFPGPGGHSLMYQRLKERQLRRARRDLVGDGRKQRVIFVGGMRWEESARRSRHAEEMHREGSIVWVSPIVHWTREHLRQYRAAFADVPRNPVADHLHMSGECLCGAFAKPGELEQIRFFYPRVAAHIERLEAKVRAAGQASCTWGQRPARTALARTRASGRRQPLCLKCVAKPPSTSPRQPVR